MSKHILIVGADRRLGISLAAALIASGHRIVTAGGKTEPLKGLARNVLASFPDPTAVYASVDPDQRPYGKKARRALRGGRHG